MPRLRAHNQLTATSTPPSSSVSTRPRRAASGANRQEEESTITVARDNSPDIDARKSIRLTVKMPSSKLREATSRPGTTLEERESFSPGEVVRGARSTRAKKQVVIESSESEEEDEEEEAEAEAEVEDEEEDEEVDAAGEDEEDAEGEDDPDAEGEDDEDVEGESDVEMADAPAPTVTVTEYTKEIQPARRAPASKPVVKPAKGGGRIKTVEEKEMQMAAAGASDDEELSELSDEDAEGEEDAEGDEVEEDEEMGDEGDEEDAEGETDDDETPGDTPDPSRLTKRQRQRLDQDFLQLPMGMASYPDPPPFPLNMAPFLKHKMPQSIKSSKLTSSEPQIKKHLTAEEHAMRRAEMARRRKNLSEKRNEEEKMETINRLLKKQAPKRRGKISAQEIAEGADTPEVEFKEVEHVDPVFSRWISNKNGMVLALPGEWKNTPMGALAGNRN
ncbi:MAG: hypothetical protein MMC23_007536 [Stictis urceolatum]|nr:hypothetical protein [Stictis urceolata]